MNVGGKAFSPREGVVGMPPCSYRDLRRMKIVASATTCNRGLRDPNDPRALDGADIHENMSRAWL